jgi:tol-pal system protein YbgF
MGCRLASLHKANPGAVVAFAAAALLSLMAAMPAHAQERLSLADRVTRLEQQAQDKQGNIGLVNQVQNLQSQIRQLQGQIEELQHQVEQMKQAGKDQYIDLDSRLRRLEGNGAPAATGSSAAPAAATTTESTPAAGSSAPAAAATTPAAAATTPAAASSADGPDAATAQAAYDAAFNALRGGDFVQSSRGFRDFIAQYPDNALTPNAYYWLGESYYITQNYPVALQTFQKLVQLYPDSPKTSGALLKIGYCQYAMKQTDAATATLQSVMDKYPGTDVANLAKRRLHDIQLQSVN